jgi:hypothetical protein
MSADSCDINMEDPASMESVIRRLTKIEREYKTLPADIKVALENELMTYEEFENYYKVMKVFWKKPLRPTWKFVEYVRLHRMFAANKGVIPEYSVQVASNIGTKLLAYAGTLGVVAGAEVSMANEMIAGLFLNIMLTTSYMKTPQYLAKLKEHELIALVKSRAGPDSWIASDKKLISFMGKALNAVGKSMGAIDKVAKQHADFLVERIINVNVKGRHLIKDCHKQSAKTLVRGAMKLAMYYFSAGLLSGYVFKLHQASLRSQGKDLPDPYPGFNPWIQGGFFAAFSINGFIRYGITKNYVIPHGNGFVSKIFDWMKSRPMNGNRFNDAFAHACGTVGNSKFMAKLMGPTALAMSAFFLNNLAASFTFKEYRETGFNFNTLMIPFMPYVNRLFKDTEAEILEQKPQRDSQ